jgi:ferredoxin
MLHALAAARSEREVWWLYSAADGAHHAFRTEADALLDRLPRARRHVRYTHPRSGDHGHDAAGRPTAEALAALNLPTDAEAYLCGPSTFLTDLTATLAGLGVDPARIYTEVFGTAAAITPGIVAGRSTRPHPPTGPPGPGPGVTFARSDLTALWDPTCTSLLELAEACEITVRWSCRTGVCQTCRTGLLDGTVAYAPDPLEPPADGEVLLCCSRPSTPAVLDL